MWEFEIMDIETGETDIIYGYNIEDACMRNDIDIDIDIDCIEVLYSEYVD